MIPQGLQVCGTLRTRFGFNPHSPSFLKPHALAGTLTPSGLPSLPPNFAPCWKALRHARGTLGSCSHQLPGFPPLRLSKSSVAKSSLPSAPAERSNHRLGERASSLSLWGGWQARITSPRPSGTRGPTCPPWPAALSLESPALSSFAPSSQLQLPPAHLHPKLLGNSVLLLFYSFFLRQWSVVVKPMPEFESSSPVHGL